MSRIFSSRLAGMAVFAGSCVLATVVMAAPPRPALRGGTASFTAAQLSKLKDALKGVPEERYRIEIQEGRNRTVLGKGSLQGLRVAQVFSPEFQQANVADEIITTVGNYVRVIWTGDTPADLAARVAEVEGMLAQGMRASLSDNKVLLRGGTALFSEGQLSALQKELKGLPENAYRLEIVRGGRAQEFGRGDLKNMRVAQVYSPEFKGTEVSNEIVTTVSDYVRIIWTGDVPRDLGERVARVEGILAGGVRASLRPNTRAVGVLRGGVANFNEAQLAAIKGELKGIPENLYHVEIERAGKTVTLGKGNILSLKAAYVYSPAFVGAQVADEIITTVGNYVRVIWTGDVPADMQQRIAKVESMLASGGRQ